MAWLWLVSVGITDVQFPVWKQDEFGQWSQRRMELGRGGCRAVHQNLLALLKQDLLTFPEGLPAAVTREEARDLRLELEEDQGSFLVSLKAPSTQATQYRISSHGNEIPNEREPRLPLYCPKVGELLKVARETFGDEAVTLVVLNTRRDATMSDGPNEPIASGPLVAKFLAERFGLHWLDGDGALPGDLQAGTSTWIDILLDKEAMEDSDAQQAVVRRISALISAWHPEGERRVAVTTSGGMPPLKPIIERVPATCLGQNAVRLLDRPERGPPTLSALDYTARVAERETLRFYCSEALRQRDYASAYGLASRFRDLTWARLVRNRLGPLLELPGGPLQIQGRYLEPFALSICQAEIALCMGDVVGALRRLALFIEAATWVVIERNAALHDLGLDRAPGEDCLLGSLPPDHELIILKLLETDRDNALRQRVARILEWPFWLATTTAQHDSAEKVLAQLMKAYNYEKYPLLIKPLNQGKKPPSHQPFNQEKKPTEGMSLRHYRNRIAHGWVGPVNLRDLEQCFRDSGLLKNINAPFGQNLLAAKTVKELLDKLGAGELAPAMGKELDSLLDKVIN